MSHKESRYCYWLVWCFLAFTSSHLPLTPNQVWAQTFDPVGLGKNLTSEVRSGEVTNAQFSELQTAELEKFLATDQAQTYYELNFNPDGVYGELKNGAVVEDWETLAKRWGLVARC